MFSQISQISWSYNHQACITSCLKCHTMLTNRRVAVFAHYMLLTVTRLWLTHILNLYSPRFNSLQVRVVKHSFPVLPAGNFVPDTMALRLGCGARRRPRLLFVFVGVFLLRLATRQFVALLFQLPPRFTRLESLGNELFSKKHCCRPSSRKPASPRCLRGTDPAL